MPLHKPASKPGFLSQATQAQAEGAWFDGNLVRWRLGLLEKIGGWQRLLENVFPAIIRKMHGWLDLQNQKNLLVATDAGMQLVVQDTVYGLGSQVSLLVGGTSFSVALGSTEVTVETDADVKLGDMLTVQLPISIGGRIIDAGSRFTVKSIVPVGFTFDMVVPAAVAEVSTNGARLFTNDVLNGFTVAWKNHGFVVGNVIQFAKTTALRLGEPEVWEEVNFYAPAGSVLTVGAVLSPDSFRVNMEGFGTGDGAGGPSHQVYDGVISDNGSNSPSAVVGLASLEPIANPQRVNWFLDNLGQNGLMLHTGGPLEVYTPPIEDGAFTDIVGKIDLSAPQKANGMFVAMPQAQVILLGIEIPADTLDGPKFGAGVVDPLMIGWSDVGTYDVYIATASNQAGTYRLSRGSKIVGGIQAPQTTLILTDLDAWTMSYIGPPLIYGFNIIASGCGLISEDAIGVQGGTTYWMGEKQFWQFGGGRVQVLPCTVYDFVFNDIDTVNKGKIFAAENSTSNEIAWFFPSLKTAIAEESGDNLLPFSHEFNKWALKVGVNAAPDARFREIVTYEPQYVTTGWFDDIGLMPVAWLNDDLQGIKEKVIFAPDGTDTADMITEFAVPGMHAVADKIDKLGKQTVYTFSVYVHTSSTRNVTLRAVSRLGSVYATFNAVTGALLASGSTSTPTFAFMAAGVAVDDPLAGHGWLRYFLTFTSDDSDTLELWINLTNGTTISYMGDISKYLLVWGAQLVTGTEVGDFHPTSGMLEQNECTKYVKYNTEEKSWDSGTLWRSAWIDSSVWGPPLGADKGLRVQQHERGYDDDDQPMRDVFAETGYTELGDGSVMLSIDMVHPDFKWFGRDGEVTVTLKTVNYPGGPVQNHERFSMTPTTQYFSPRARARYAAMRYEWTPLRGFSARVGVTTYRVKPAGRRP